MGALQKAKQHSIIPIITNNMTTVSLFDQNGEVDIFGFSKEDYKPYFKGFYRPKFRRDSSLDEDIIDLQKKWKGHPNEVLVQHMVDSLIIFNYNRKYVNPTN